MQPLTEILLINAASVALLALVVALIGRVIKRPAVMHVLWLLVLLKLLTPPVFEIAALPRLDSLIAAEADSAPIPAELLLSLPADVRVETPRSGLAAASVAIWIAGSALLLSLVIVRVVRFRRLLVASPPVDATVREEATRVARRIGVSVCPRIRLIPGRVPPMIWSCLGRCNLLLPAGLIGALGVAERETLLAHELAHVRRRDPWVRHVEILATVLFWWHPVVWWARRNLRLNEERSCDALVLEALPRQTRAYAHGLIKTLDFLSAREPTVPAVATGAVGTRQLEERLTMIVKGTTPRRTTPAQRFLLATVVAGTLLVFPTWIDRAAADGEPPSPREERYTAELLDLEQEALELELRLREVEAARMEISAAIREERAHSKREAIEKRAQEAEASGKLEEADELRRAAEEMERHRLLEAEQVDSELALLRESTEMESHLQELAVELERARAENDLARAEALAARARDLELDLGHVHSEAEQRRLALMKSRMAAQLDVLRAKAAAARAGGDVEQVSKIEQLIELQLQELQTRQRVTVDLAPVGHDVLLHEEDARKREIQLKIKLEKLEQMKLETENEILRREETLDELRRELEELHTHD